MSEATDRAFVLHRRPYRETSLLVELLTADHGRVGVVARGGRRGRKGAGSGLEPYRPLRVAWRGKGELKTLAGVEPAGAPPRLAGETLYLGFYLNELLLRTTARFDPHPRLAAGYEATLQRLSAGLAERALRAFEAHLLDELGVGPDWTACAGCGATVSAEQSYAFQAEMGLLCPACAPGRTPFSGAGALALRQPPEDIPESALRPARDLARAALAPHLGDRPLESRQLLRSLRDKGG